MKAKLLHCKKRLVILNYSRPGRVCIVTYRLGSGKSLTFFYSVFISLLIFLYNESNKLKQQLAVRLIWAYTVYSIHQMCNIWFYNNYLIKNNSVVKSKSFQTWRGGGEGEGGMYNIKRSFEISFKQNWENSLLKLNHYVP